MPMFLALSKTAESASGYVSEFEFSQRSISTPMLYVPKTPNYDSRWRPDYTQDGMRPQSVAYQNVQESMDFLLEYRPAAGTPPFATVRAAWERLLEIEQEAREFNSGIRGSSIWGRYFVVWAPQGDWASTSDNAKLYRSPIYELKFDLHEQAMSPGRWGRSKIYARATWTRAPYWECVEEERVTWQVFDAALAQNAGFYNDAYPPQANWVSIRAQDIKGETVSPLRLEIDNVYEDGERVGTIWVGQGMTGTVITTGARGQHMIQAETAISGGSTVSNVSASGNNVRRATFSGTTAQQLMVLPLGSLVSASRGGKHRVFVKIMSMPVTNEARLEFRLAIAGTTNWFYTSPEVRIYNGIAASDIFVDLGEVTLPPSNLPKDVSPGDLDLALYGYRDSGASTTIDVDWVTLMPADHFRMYDYRGYGLPVGWHLFDDPYNESLYAMDMSTGKAYTHYTAYGGPLWVYPGRSNFYAFLTRSTTGGITKNRITYVNGYYRPRRLAV